MIRKNKWCLLLSGVLLIISAWQAIAQPNDSVRTITLNAVAGLQYDIVRFTVKPGERIQIVLVNKDDMSHNLLITKPGKRPAVVDAALKLAEKGPQMNYIPQTPEVLWAIPVLAPGERKSISFTAPKDEGIYPYVCTFPGHGFSMYGAMYVSTNEKMPALNDDENIPQQRRKPTDGATAPDQHAGHASASAHPYKVTPPVVYRAYMDNASAAAIAVNLPHNISYCWDAATCELRYAWTGDFVDNSGLWKGKPNSVAKVLGVKFFEIKMRHPLRVGVSEAAPVVEFLGYRLIERHPEFHYTINGVEVFELIHANEDGTALIRTFRIPDAKQPVWFIAHSSDGADYRSSKGKWQDNRLKISREDARTFTITMNKKVTTK